MNLLTLEGLSKSYGECILFADISFSIAEREKVGLIGVNGTGKSTFLKIVAGIEEADQARVVKSNLRISYLPQEPVFDREETVLRQAFRGDSLPMALLRDYEELLEKISKRPQDAALQTKMLAITQQMTPEIWNLESVAKTVLTSLGITNFSDRVGTLSGGQRKRVALAGALICPADLLILDEPTNHIDSDTVVWLEEYLLAASCAVLMITHDRYFLDRVVGRIVELDRGKLYSYGGNYSVFLTKKIEREEIAAAHEAKRQNLLRNELAWIRRGAQARSTKQKARIERFKELEAAKPDAVENNVEIVAGSTRLGKKVIEISTLSKSFGGKNLIHDFDYLILRDDRIGIIGPNGSGKTTLLNMINGDIQPDSGFIDIGATVKLGYFSQENEHMDPGMRVIDYIKEQAEFLAVGDGRQLSAAQMLELFLFSPHLQWTPIGKLSGGERRRLYLLRVLMAAPNVLLLDEPTNDLDIQTLTVLEDYLDSFKGAVLAVSHDRYFLDRIAGKILSFETPGIMEYVGNYSDYMEYVEKTGLRQVEKKTAVEKTTREKPKDKSLKFTFKEQKEYEEIDEVIAQAEAELKAVTKEMELAGSDFVLLEKLTKSQQDLTAQLDTLMERWTYLNELAEEIEKQNDN